MLIHYFGGLRGLSRNVLFYLAATALIGISFDGGVFTVLFNLFLLRLGFGPEYIGLVNSAGLLAFALASLPAGPIGTRFGTRRLLVIGLMLMGFGGLAVPIFAPMLPVAWMGGVIIALWIVMYTGMAIYFVNAVPFIMEISSESERSQAFSLQTAVLSLAAFTGALLGGFLPRLFTIGLGVDLQDPAPYRFPLIMSGTILLFSIWLILQVRRTAPEASATVQTAPALAPSTAPVAAPRRIGWLRVSPIMSTILLLSTVRLFQVSGVATSFTFFNVYMDTKLMVAPEQIGIIAAIARLIGVGLALVTPYAISRIGAPNTVLLASVVSTVSLLPLALVATPFAAGLGHIGVTAFSSMRFPAFMIYCMSLVPANWRGTVAGLGEFFGGISFAVIAYVGGYIISSQGFPPLFLIGAALTFIGTLLFFVWYVIPDRGKRAPEPVPSGPVA